MRGPAHIESFPLAQWYGLLLAAWERADRGEQSRMGLVFMQYKLRLGRGRRGVAFKRRGGIVSGAKA